MKYDLDKILEVAKKTADLSSCKYRISCILVDQKGNIVSKGFNHWAMNGRRMGQRTVHAECDALEKVMKPSGQLTAFIYRVGGKNGEMPNRINPCQACAKLLKAYGITRVFCTWDGGWRKEP